LTREAAQFQWHFLCHPLILPPAELRLINIVQFIKDQLTTSSWLALGACLNAVLFLAIGRIALALPFILLGYRFGDALLQTWGFKKNPYMEGQIMKKYSAQLPNPDGTFGPKAANQQIVVFMIGARCNQ
jgi:hypothetical protein